MKLDKRELATVLAALRAWQDFPRPHTAPFAPFFEDAEPLTRDEIEELCQRLNTDPMREALEADGQIVVEYTLASEDYKRHHYAGFATVDDYQNEHLESEILGFLYPDAESMPKGEAVQIDRVNGEIAHVCGDECRSNGCAHRYQD